MSKGYTSYKCECGGIIDEQWDSYGYTATCDSCDYKKHIDDSEQNDKGDE